MSKKTSIKAFSFLELSLVILIVGILVSAFLGAVELSNEAKLRRAKTLTQNSPVNGIAGLVLWLDTTSEQSFIESEKNDGTAITKWSNLNPNASTTSQLSDSSVATDDNPVYRESCFNGLPCLYFDGGDKITAPKPLGVRSEYLSLFAVFSGAENASGASYEFLKSDLNANWDNSSGAFILSGTSGQAFFYDMPGPSGIQPSICNGAAVTNQNQAYVYSLIDDNSGSIFHYFNGGKGNTTGGDGSLSKSLGVLEIGRSSYRGNIGEIIIFTRALSLAERKSVEQYLGKKWGIKTS